MISGPERLDNRQGAVKNNPKGVKAAPERAVFTHKVLKVLKWVWQSRAGKNPVENEENMLKSSGGKEPSVLTLLYLAKKFK